VGLAVNAQDGGDRTIGHAVILTVIVREDVDGGVDGRP